MRLFPPPAEVGEQEGFTKEKDIFDRRGIGDGLTNLICRVDEPLVIAIDNEWGTGKTTFLQMWAGELRKLAIPVIYFDAFEHDYVEDAFTAIASEIISLAAERKSENEPSIQKFLKCSKSAAKILLRSGLRIGVKLGTAGVLDAADIGSASAELSKEASELEDKYLGELLTKQAHEKQAIQSFREALEELPSLLAAQPTDDNKLSTIKPLVIIIDELDRCRPTFALQILERIKHFFAVSGVHFVLGTHTGQLRNSIAAIYGPGIDAEKYLQKFIHLTIHLTESAYHPHQRTTAKYIDYLFTAMELSTGLGSRTETIKDYLWHLAHHQKLSLRALERIISALAIAIASRPKNTFCSDPIMVGLCALKIIDPQTYVRAKSGEKVYQNARIALALESPPVSGREHAVAHVAKVWRFYSDPDIADDNPDYQGFGSHTWEYNLERWAVVGHVARAIVDRLQETPR